MGLLDFLAQPSPNVIPDPDIKAAMEAQEQPEIIPTFSLPEAVPPEQVVTVAPPARPPQPGGSLLSGEAMPLLAPASVAPIRQARQTLESLPQQWQQMTEQGLKRIGQAKQQVQQAAMSYGKAVSEQTAAQADVLRSGLAAIDQVRAEYQRRLDTAREQVASKMAEYEQAKQRLAEYHIDPERLTRGGKGALAAIGVALGAMGSALARTPNTALAIVQGAIDRDIRAQEAELAKRKGEVAQAMSEVNLARQMFADEQSQQLAAQAMAWNRYAKQAQIIGMQHQGQVEQAKAGQLAAAAEAKATELEQQLAQRQQQLSLSAASAALSGAQAEVAARQQGQQFRFQQQLTQQKQRALEAKAKMLAQSLEPPGLKIANPSRYTPTQDDKKKAQEMVRYYRQTYSIINDLISQREKFTLGKRLSPKERARLEATFNRLKSVMRKLDETGARIDPGEIEMMGLPEDPKDFIGVLPRLRKVRELITRQTLEGLMPYGYSLSSQPSAAARKVSR